MVVQQRQLLRAREPDETRQPQHGAVGDDAVARGAEAEHGIVGGQAQIAGEADLQAAADRVAVQHAQGDLRHVLQPVERAHPGSVKRLADGTAGQRRAIHPRAERGAGAAHDDQRHVGIGGRRVHAVGQRRHQRRVERVEDGGPLQRDPGHAVGEAITHGQCGHRL